MTDVPPSITCRPDKAMYRPGELVTLILTPAPQAEVTLHLYEGTQEIQAQAVPFRGDVLRVTWTPPVRDGAYGAEFTLSGSAQVLAATAFDVHGSWLAAPRYGFMADFGPGAEPGRVARLAAYHVNALQFYDWMYRHDQHLADWTEYVDSSGRPLSLDTVRRLIGEAHALGMAAMPYTTIYGASAAYGKAHPEQTLYRPDGRMWNFGEDFLMTMNPAPGSGWRGHIMGEYRRILEALPFDGLHIDQYGNPKVAHDHTGRQLDLADVIPGFVREAKTLAAAYPGRDAVIFNLVGTWPAETVQPSGVDAVYMEIWPPDDRYADLCRVIGEAHARSGGRPVILTAYLSAAFDAGTRLLDAVIAASGATHLELGEAEDLLGDPYFPKYERPGAPLRNWLHRYYDFITRYQTYLYGGDPLELVGLDFGDARVFGGATPAGRIWALGRRGTGFDVLHLINMVGVSDDCWRADKEMPTPQEDISVRYEVKGAVRQVDALSPDGGGTRTSLDFVQSGNVVEFILPRLDLWTTIVMDIGAKAQPRRRPQQA